MLFPQTVWQDYNPHELPLGTERIADGEKDNIITSRYGFIACGSGEDTVKVSVSVYTPIGKDIVHDILIVHDYCRMPDDEVIIDLVKEGYRVIVPDISGVSEYPTDFGKKYFYGNYEKSGERLNRIINTARDTCQYIYSVIIKRALVFAERELNAEKPVLIGIGDAVEVAMQVAGSGAAILALAALNGSGYREYVKLNKFGGGKELDMDEERMCWLSGVASVAYAKYVTVPVFIALGTNAIRSDMDRITNFAALFPEKQVSVVLSPRAGDYLDPEAYVSFKVWLKNIFNGKNFHKNPVAAIRINEDGVPYIDVTVAKSDPIDSVSIFYSIGEYNHALRDWFKLKAITVSDREYIATPVFYSAEQPIFAFAEVKYSGGEKVSSEIAYSELKGQPVKNQKREITRVVYQPGFGTDSFTEDYSGDILFKRGIYIAETESGAKGVSTRVGGIKTYNIGTHSASYKDSILQIEFASRIERSVTLTVQKAKDGILKNYTHCLSVTDTKGYFNSFRLAAADFKDESLMPLTDFYGVKSLTVSGSGIILGNIIFI